MKVVPQIRVPYIGEDGQPSEFVFVQPPRAFGALLPLAERMAAARIADEEQRLGRSLSAEEQAELLSSVEARPAAEGSLNGDLFAAFVAVFQEGVVEWSGVTDANGKPLPCDAANKASVPLEDQAVIAAAYFARRRGLEKKPSLPENEPTTP